MYLGLGTKSTDDAFNEAIIRKTALRQTKKTHLGNTSVIIKVIHLKYCTYKKKLLRKATLDR